MFCFLFNVTSHFWMPSFTRRLCVSDAHERVNSVISSRGGRTLLHLRTLVTLGWISLGGERRRKHRNRSPLFTSSLLTIGAYGTLTWLAHTACVTYWDLNAWTNRCTYTTYGRTDQCIHYYILYSALVISNPLNSIRHGPYIGWLQGAGGSCLIACDRPSSQFPWNHFFF